MTFNSINRKKHVLVALVIVLLVGGLVAFMHLQKVHSAQKQSGTIPTVKQADKSEDGSKKAENSSDVNSSQAETPSSSTQKVAGTVAASGTLAAPSGSFISNHRPGQNGTSTQVESICTTTPGATCYIQFSKDGVIKKLDSKPVDSSGSVIWDWDIKGANLSPGSWQITAVASLNGETKTTVDPNGLLEVK